MTATPTIVRTEIHESTRMSQAECFLFHAQVGQLPDDGFDDFVVLTTGMPDDSNAQEVPDQGDLDFLLVFVCLAADCHEAEAAVRSAWADIASGELTIHLLSSNRRELTRLVRRLLNELGHGGVARVGSAVGFKRGSTEALNDADSIINIACIRKTWRFWR